MNVALLFAAAALAATAAPALAQPSEINPQARIVRAIRQGCSVQHVHTPTGKLVHAPPIVRCDRTFFTQAKYVGVNENAAQRRSPQPSRPAVAELGSL